MTEPRCHRSPEALFRPTVVAERQASAGARDGVKGKRNDLAARAPLHALVGRLVGTRMTTPGLALRGRGHIAEELSDVEVGNGSREADRRHSVAILL